MICYAIKNKEGRYIKKTTIFDGFRVVEKLCDAELFSYYCFAEFFCPRNCKVVKVEIREAEYDGGVK